MLVTEGRLTGRLLGGSSVLKGGHPRVRTAAWSQEEIWGDGRQAPVWNCPGGQSRPFGVAGGLPVPVTAAAGRPGSSRRGREEHPPLAVAAAAAQLSERRPQSLWASGDAAFTLCGARGFRVVPAQLPHREAGVGGPAGAAVRLPAPPCRAAAMAGT